MVSPSKAKAAASKTTTPAPQPEPEAQHEDPLDNLVEHGPLRAIALLLWKERYRNPEFAIQVTAADLQGFEACTSYLQVEPKILIRRPPGQPAVPAMPPSRRFPEGFPARAAEPPRPYVLVSMVDAKTGDAFKPIENSEEGAKIRDRENALRRLRERAPLLAQAVASNAAQNVFSGSEITELCNAAIELARA